jgi:hypothetical protein
MAYSQSQKIDSPSPVINGNFGSVVVVDEQYAAISQPLSVKTFLYRRDTEGQWQSRISGGIGRRGSSLFIYGNHLVVGDSVVGDVSVYDKETTTDTPIVTFTGLAASRYGASVAMSENYIVVGAPGVNSDKGEIYIYEKTGVNQWTAYSENPISDSLVSINDYFGNSVATNDTSIIVGAYGDSLKKGSVYIYEKNEDTNIWEKTQKIFASQSSLNDEFGAAISVSGDYLVVGAKLQDSETGGTNAGAVYLYKYGTSWYEIDKLIGVGESIYEGNHFGESVCIKGDYIIVGSPNARSIGVADVFYHGRSWGHLKKIIGSDSSLSDDFGVSVSVSGRFLLIGSSSNDNITSNDGAAYLYEDSSVQLRLAQEFEVNREFMPSKASVYLKRVGKNDGDNWSISNTDKTVIDTTNFSTIDQASTDTVTEYKVDQLQKLIISDGGTDDFFGFCVDIDGDYMVVAAPGENAEQGAAYIFYRNSDALSNREWEQVKKITANDGAAGDWFGISVSIDGDYIVVGAYLADIGGDASAGAAYVFYRDPDNPSGNWNEIKKLTALDGKAGDNLGRSVSVSGNYVVAGAPMVDSPGAQAGAVYIFSIDLSNPSNESGELQKIQSDNIAAGDAFGRDVVIEGNYIVVGARGTAADGSTYVFYGDPYNPSDSEWKQIKELIASDPEGGSYFGEAVSISGNYIVVGAYSKNEYGFANAGAVYIFHKDEGGVDNWGEFKKITANDPETSAYFGYSVSISGKYIIVGSNQKNEFPGDNNEGAAYIFYKDDGGVDNWGEFKKIIAGDPEEAAEFGYSVSICGDDISIGARYKNEPANDEGAAYVFYKDIHYEGSNIIIFNDTIEGFTGNGYMFAQNKSVPATEFSTVNYPLKATVSDTYDLWIRYYSLISFNVEILIDGKNSKTMEDISINPSMEEWLWFNTTIVLPDREEHILGIKIKGNEVAIDKIYIEDTSIVPYLEGPDYSKSPYLTAHMKVYNSAKEDPSSPSIEPANPLYVYDYKNSITEIVQDDWYNFNIKTLDEDRGYTKASDFDGSYFLVLAVSGSNNNNFVIWEVEDSDEYWSSVSAIKF